MNITSCAALSLYSTFYSREVYVPPYYTRMAEAYSIMERYRMHMWWFKVLKFANSALAIVKFGD